MGKDRQRQSIGWGMVWSNKVGVTTPTALCCHCHTRFSTLNPDNANSEICPECMEMQPDHVAIDS